MSYLLGLGKRDERLGAPVHTGKLVEDRRTAVLAVNEMGRDSLSIDAGIAKKAIEKHAVSATTACVYQGRLPSGSPCPQSMSKER